MPWTYDKPKVRREGEGLWLVELEHSTWTERGWYGTWERAMEHALWIGLNAGVWAIP